MLTVPSGGPKHTGVSKVSTCPLSPLKNPRCARVRPSLPVKSVLRSWHKVVRGTGLCLRGALAYLDGAVTAAKGRHVPTHRKDTCGEILSDGWHGSVFGPLGEENAGARAAPYRSLG